eukprot:scaffold434_cov186-Pinguiococcus_pyrenoidosus.AAC.26
MPFPGVYVSTWKVQPVMRSPTCGFVAQNAREKPLRVFAAESERVRVAQRGVRDLHAHFSWAWRTDHDLFHAESVLETDEIGGETQRAAVNKEDSHKKRRILAQVLRLWLPRHSCEALDGLSDGGAEASSGKEGGGNQAPKHRGRSSSDSSGYEPDELWSERARTSFCGEERMKMEAQTLQKDERTQRCHCAGF